MLDAIWQAFAVVVLVVVLGYLLWHFFVRDYRAPPQARVFGLTAGVCLVVAGVAAALGEAVACVPAMVIGLVCLGAAERLRTRLKRVSRVKESARSGALGVWRASRVTA